MGSGMKDDTEDEDIEGIIIALELLDAWLMTVVIFLTDYEIRSGCYEKLCIETFVQYIPIFMDQISGSFYSFVFKWEPEDRDSSYQLNLQLSIGESISKEQFFNKTYTSCVSIHIPSMKGTFLVITIKWFTYYVGDELGIVHDCYMS